jgi:CheY-like chemotaxis protein/HPt (histidine-containing phosphotransfer) domain-containing protein
VEQRVLVVDDGAVNRMLLVRMLEVLGVPADTAQDARAARQVLADHGYAAVLMDVRMPDEDGLAVTAWLRDHEAGRRTPVIGVSAAQSTADRALCTDAGMDGFLAKPVSLADLRRVLTPYVALVAEAPAPAGPLDDDRLRSLEDQLGDADLVRETVRTYLAELPGRRVALRSALADDDRGTLRLVSHSLKSSSAMLGAVALSEACAELEQQSADGEPEALAALVGRVEARAPEAADALSRWLDRP